jgi:hypothetical protein
MIAETLLMSSLALANPELDLTLPEPPREEIERISQIVERDRKTFQFVNVTNIPSERSLRISKILHTLDVMTTIYAMDNRNNIVEGNPLLPDRPTKEQLIAQKAILLTLAHHNFEEGQIVIINWTAGFAVARNLYVINRYN